MAKLTYGAITVKAYAHNISEFRNWYQRIASFVAKAPGAAVDVNASLQPLVAATGFVQNQPATKALLTTGQALVVPVTGTYATTATVTIAGGVVTAIVLS